MSVATTASGPRGGSFVHPFQQTPRTSTPPLLSYANSLASFDNGQRDYSPTITEDDDDGLDGLASNNPYPSSTAALHSRSQSNLRRPSIVSRTSSLSDITSPPPPHTTQTATRTSISSIHNTAAPVTATTASATATGAPRPSTKSRLTPSGLSSSRSDLNLTITTASTSTGAAKSLPANSLLLDSPGASLASPASASTAVTAGAAPSSSSSALLLAAAAAASAAASAVTSPTSSAATAPMSPLRSSLEMASFPRMRAAPEVSSATHMDLVRHERRKFEEKQSRKQERYDQKLVRKRDRDLTREAVKKEAEEAARARKSGSFTGPSSSGAARRLAVPSPSSTFPAAKSKSNPSLPSGLAHLKKKKTARSEGNDSAKESSPLGPGIVAGDVRATTAAVASDSSTAAGADMFTGDAEKSASFPSFERHHYYAATAAKSPGVPTVEEDVHFTAAPRRRTNTAKAKTHGAWTSFILWLRTKLFRLSKSS